MSSARELSILSFFLRLSILCLGLLLFPSGADAAAAEGRAKGASQTMALAGIVESRASQTDFAALERFGAAAQQMDSREGLNRLYHVTWLFQTQADYDKAKLWNDRLAAAAAREHDARYQMVARLNALAARYTQGDLTVVPEIARIHATELDWFTRAHAARLQALAMIDEGQTGQALRILTDAESAIPMSGPQVDTARAGIWEVVGIGLMQIHDYEGSAAAFNRFEVEFTNPLYPRPDFDSLYNLAKMASQSGDFAVADRLAAAHHRLSERTGMHSLQLWDVNLCARMANDRAEPRAVLRCIAPVGAELAQPTAMTTNLLRLRAVARAQTGDAAGARRDFEVVRQLDAAAGYNEARRTDLMNAEAEVLFAEGRTREAFLKLRRFNQQENMLQLQTFSSGIHQVTGDLEVQLAERRKALTSANALAAADARMLLIGRYFIVLVVILLASLLGVLFWQIKQARRLKAATRLADEANRSKSEFLANMSHEIRTPLNGVIGINAALARTELTPEQAKMVDLIATSGETLETLLTDVLDLARIESGHLELKAEPFDLEDCLESVVALFEAGARLKALDFSLDVAPSVAGAFVGDVVRIRQVVSNLLSNAVKFTGQGSIVLKATRDDEGRVVIAVTDTGIGFDADFKARLFQRFEQADGSITRRFGGTGLGLAISRALAEAMDGTLEADAEPGVGSTFTLTLNLARAPDAAVVKASSPVRARPQEAGAPRVLLAEDHPINRKVVELLFDGTGVLLTSVENGAEAVALYETEAFDMVLMDMQMPVMDGLTAIRLMRGRELAEGIPATPIYTLSANAMPEHAEASLQAGANGHLTKPIAAASLFAALEAALSSADGAGRSAEAEGETDIAEAVLAAAG
ncbi:MAG: signal transduction histidine kinase/FixJ family two-component response regulator [Brevundimonas sp.]